MSLIPKMRLKTVLAVVAVALGTQTAVEAATPTPRGISLTEHLKTLNLEPPNLGDFVKDKQAAIALGKALFWDMSIGSDGVQACASCHFSAGADNRAKNQLSPGLNRKLQNASSDKDTTFSPHGPNYTLTADDFPLHKLSDPLNRYSTVERSSNDIVSSQGVASREFVNVIPGYPVDLTKYLADPDGFQVDGVNTRRVEPRNTPSVVNAVLNFRNFWDGRAQNDFNGVNPFGSRDPDAFLYKVNSDGKLEKTKVSLINSSLASQAVGPVLSFEEMSAKNRSFAKVGVKILPMAPLARQLVAKDDSVLGAKSRAPFKGLKVNSYKDMVKAAFKEQWYNGNEYLRVTDSGVEVLSKGAGILSKAKGEKTFTQAEFNFSLFFGLAVQMYESTLISDQTRFDRYLDGYDTLSEQEAHGFELFGNNTINEEGPARCSNCHGGPETTDASIFKVSQAPSTTAIKGGVGPLRRRGNSTFTPAVNNIIDLGFNNIGVSATLEDLGVGGNDPFGNPLSVARQEALLLAQGAEYPKVRNADGTPFIKSSDINGVDGAFKIPMLRNVELTAPYFHNGDAKTLDEVLDLYMRGGNFQSAPAGAVVKSSNLPELPVGATLQTGFNVGFDATRQNQVPIAPLGTLAGPNFDNVPAQNSSLIYHGGALNEDDKQAIIALLKAMTDDRVKYRKAPFDHPELYVPNGHIGDENTVINVFGSALDQFKLIPAVGKDGGAPLSTFLGIQQ